MSTLQGQTILIVGGSSGIGFGVALASLKSLASKVIIASSSSERVKNAVDRLQNHGYTGKVEGRTLDAKDFAAVKKFMEEVGEIDHLVWTSGEPIQDMMQLVMSDAGVDKLKGKPLSYSSPKLQKR